LYRDKKVVSVFVRFHYAITVHTERLLGFGAVGVLVSTAGRQ
jgi:hypothetical protein